MKTDAKIFDSSKVDWSLMMILVICHFKLSVKGFGSSTVYNKGWILTFGLHCITSKYPSRISVVLVSVLETLLLHLN